MNEHKCGECSHFEEHDVEDLLDRFGDAWASMCCLFYEHGEADDEACDRFDGDSE